MLKEKGLDDVLVVVGGIIPDQDIPKLREMGVTVFVGHPMQIVDFINGNARRRAGSRHPTRHSPPRGDRDRHGLSPAGLPPIVRCQAGIAYTAPGRRQRHRGGSSS